MVICSKDTEYSKITEKKIKAAVKLCLKTLKTEGASRFQMSISGKEFCKQDLTSKNKNNILSSFSMNRVFPKVQPSHKIRPILFWGVLANVSPTPKNKPYLTPPTSSHCSFFGRSDLVPPPTLPAASAPTVGSILWLG